MTWFDSVMHWTVPAIGPLIGWVAGMTYYRYRVAKPARKNRVLRRFGL